MNAMDVIESYVADVTGRLPRKQRDDVAFELRALLTEELHGRAEAAGRAADAAMATELARAFGRPAEVAARYRPALTIIDPGDGPLFLRLTVIGLAIIWVLGLLVIVGPALKSGGSLLVALGQWWTSTVIPSLWWPGVLVVGFALGSWGRRRWPGSSEWKPRDNDRIQGSRASLVLAILGIGCGLFLLLNPAWILDVTFGGRAAPAAYDALTYTDEFRHRQGPWLLVLLMLNIPILLTVLVHGRWTALLRRIELALGLVITGVLLWTALDGPILLAPASDQMTKMILVLIVAFTLIGLAMRLHRSIREVRAKRFKPVL